MRGSIHGLRRITVSTALVLRQDHTGMPQQTEWNIIDNSNN